MNRITAAALTLPLLAAGCGTAATLDTSPLATNTSSSFVADRGSATTAAVLPAGTKVLVHLRHAVGPDDAGEMKADLSVPVLEPVLSADGRTLIPAGATLHGAIDGPVRDSRTFAPLARVHFDAIEVEGRSYPVTTKVRIVDLAVNDDDTPTRWPGLVVAGDTDAAIAGAIVDDPEWQQSIPEISNLPGTFVSLGTINRPGFPDGTRLEVEIIERTPLS